MKTLSEHLKKIRRKITCFSVLLGCLVFVGCAELTPNYSSLPEDATSQQKVEALVADARARLENKNFQESVYHALIVAGRLALNHAVNEEEKKEIQLQMYAWGKMFDDLSTGEAVSADDVEEMVKTFNLEYDADKDSDFLIAANGLFNMVFPLLKTVRDADLAITYAQIAARASKVLGAMDE